MLAISRLLRKSAKTAIKPSANSYAAKLIQHAHSKQSAADTTLLANELLLKVFSDDYNFSTSETAQIASTLEDAKISLTDGLFVRGAGSAFHRLFECATATKWVDTLTEQLLAKGQIISLLEAHASDLKEIKNVDSDKNILRKSRKQAASLVQSYQATPCGIKYAMAGYGLSPRFPATKLFWSKVLQASGTFSQPKKNIGKWLKSDQASLITHMDMAFNSSPHLVKQDLFTNEDWLNSYKLYSQSDLHTEMLFYRLRDFSNERREEIWDYLAEKSTELPDHIDRVPLMRHMPLKQFSNLTAEGLVPLPEQGFKDMELMFKLVKLNLQQEQWANFLEKTDFTDHFSYMLYCRAKENRPRTTALVKALKEYSEANPENISLGFACDSQATRDYTNSAKFKAKMRASLNATTP